MTRVRQRVISSLTYDYGFNVQQARNMVQIAQAENPLPNVPTQDATAHVLSLYYQALEPKPLRTQIQQALVGIGFAASQPQARAMISRVEAQRGPIADVPVQTAVDYVMNTIHRLENPPRAPAPPRAHAHAHQEAPGALMGAYRLTPAQIQENRRAQQRLMAGNYQELVREFPGNKPKGKLTKAQINTIQTLSGQTYLSRKSQQQGQADKSCMICLDDFQKKDTLRQLPCGHVFHKKCIDKWLSSNNQCPHCRQPVIKK